MGEWTGDGTGEGTVEGVGVAPIVVSGASTGFSRGFRVTFAVFARPFAAGLAVDAARPDLAVLAALGDLAVLPGLVAGALATFFAGFTGLAVLGAALAFGFALAARGFGLEADRDEGDFLDVLTG